MAMKTSEARSSRSWGETAIDRDVEVWLITCTTRPKNRSTKSSQACDCRARHRCKSWRSMSESATRVPLKLLREKLVRRSVDQANCNFGAGARLDCAKHCNIAVFYVAASTQTSAT